MWAYAQQLRRRNFRLALTVVVVVASIAGMAEAQATPEPAPEKKAEGAADPAAPPPTPTPTPTPTPAPAPAAPRVAVQTGAPQPVSQNQASAVQSTPSNAAAVLKVGGNMILIYANNYAPEYDQLGNKKKQLVDVWRAGIVLDSKFDRFGLHLEFRARDRTLRWSPVNAWFEELYASADIIRPTNPVAPLTLKVGKTFMQFGRFWDNSFYGNIQLRDGLKLDANWGLSLEGQLNMTKELGIRYFAQYFALDGQVNTANQNRDTPAILYPPSAGQAPGTTTAPIGARRRDRYVVKLEPFIKLSESVSFRVGGSFDYFTADYPDSQSQERIDAKSRIKDIDNKEKVMRYGADCALQLKWFAAWAEWIHQDGAHTNAWPIAPRADNPATPANEARAGSSSDDVTYYMAGGSFTISRFTLQYNYSEGIYRNILALDAYPGRPASDQPRATHIEWIHNPSLQIKVIDQIRLILETPFWFRKPIPGLVAIDPEQVTLTTGKEKKEVVEQQVLLTLHGKF